MPQGHDRAVEELVKEFGPRFIQSIFELEPGSWKGPVESGYGWHLVFVESSTPGRVPAFEEVELDVRAGWRADQRSAAWRKAYEAMRAKYELVLPAPQMAKAGSDVAPRASSRSPQSSSQPGMTSLRGDWGYGGGSGSR